MAKKLMKRCEFCGIEFVASQKNQKYDSTRCRVRAYRARQTIETTDETFFHVMWTPEERAKYHKLSEISLDFGAKAAAIAKRYGNEAARQATLAAWSVARQLEQA